MHHTFLSHSSFRTVALSAVLFGLVGTGCAASANAESIPSDESSESEALVAEDLPNFFATRPGVFRGGRPTAAGYAKLKALGVKTVIDLEAVDLLEGARQSDVDFDRTTATAAGMRWVHIPMQAYTTGLASKFDAKVDRAVALLENHGAGGIYVHCKHGRDRTGLVMGLDRVENQGWDAETAYEEMVTRGFRTYFIGMKEYFERRTGIQN